MAGKTLAALGRALGSWQFWSLLALAALPLADGGLHPKWRLSDKMPEVFIYAILALGLNVVVGYTGLLHLGIAAFFAVGVYTIGILTFSNFPFQLPFWPMLVAGPLVAALFGLLLAIPTLRVRGDYLAIVTLGVGEIVPVALKNLEPITNGVRGLNPVAAPIVAGRAYYSSDVAFWYFFSLAALVVVYVLVRNLEDSRLGRAWMAIREDELAARCMGIRVGRAKVIAFTVGAALAGLAGVLLASYIQTTAEPSSYDFLVSAAVLCMIILGGVGNVPGVLLGALILRGFDVIVSPRLTETLTSIFGAAGSRNELLQFSNWRWFIYGMAMVLVMRFRPEGLLPSRRIAAELHEHEDG